MANSRDGTTKIGAELEATKGQLANLLDTFKGFLGFKSGNNSFRESIEELIEELRHYSYKIEFNPSRLEEIEDRLSEINGLKRKYGGDISLVLDYREKISTELDTLSCFHENLEKVQKDIKLHQTILSELSVVLAEKREKTAGVF